MYKVKGHTIILMEVDSGRTFLDFKDLVSAKQFLLDLQPSEGKIEDQFQRLDVFEFNEDVSRYRLLTREEVATLVRLPNGLVTE